MLESTTQLGLNYVFIIFGLFFLAIMAYLIASIERQKRARQELENSLKKLKQVYDELDQQAKIIVKTDLELDRTKEALDKKVRGLFILHELARTISNISGVENIFFKIDQSFIYKLGFDKGLIFLNEGQPPKLNLKLNVGYNSTSLDKISRYIQGTAISELIQSDKFLIIRRPQFGGGREKELAELFNAESLLLVPILIKEKFSGAVFLGRDSPYNPITESDGELISIFANQLSQALENAMLYEQIWKSHRELELRVTQRTKELARANDELKRLNKTKSDFVSAVSHELRTPLTSIKGYASILASEKLGALPPAVKERLKKIDKHSDNLTKLVNGLLDISRIESGKVEMKIEELKLRDLIDEVLDIIAPVAKAKEIEVRLKLSEDVVNIWADKSQISRVFINLLNNAVKFTPQKGNVTIEVHSANGYYQFSVIDTGIGISKQDLPNLFTEFYRADNVINQKERGTGLGLSLVKRIIEAHGGKIWVESKPGEGSNFIFTLPKEPGVKF
jgi:signal transduction histidine kinase